MSTNYNPLLYRNRIDVNDASLDPLLRHLQANILKYHGRKHAWHVFIKFSAGKEEAVKDWVRQYAWKVSSAKNQLEDVELRRTNPVYDGGAVICFFLSKAGYEILGFDVAKTIGVGLENMRDRIDALDDPLLKDWECRYQESCDAMILLADGYIERLERELDIIKKQTMGIARVMHVQKGETLRNEDGLSIEHFGYVDGISQPRFLKGEVAPGNAFDDNTNLAAVLVEERVNGYSDCFGSFMVFRKLEQDVKSFNEKVNALASMLHPGNNTAGTNLAAAYVIGRFKDSTPVVKHPQELGIHTEKAQDNDFNFNNDLHGRKCPFHAHIRMTAPRDIIPSYQLKRIVRRAIPYDEAGRNNDMTWYPERKAGLLFMCYQPDISDYFERLQATWANHGEIDQHKKAAMDGVIGQGNDNERPQRWPLNWGGQEAIESFRFSDTVTLKGGEYFFAPSIPFLLRMKPSDPRQ